MMELFEERIGFHVWIIFFQVKRFKNLNSKNNKERQKAFQSQT